MKFCTFHYYVEYFLESTFIECNGFETQDLMMSILKKAVG